MAENDANAPFMTLRDVVMEIRLDVKTLKENLATLPGVVDDHESRLRGLEKKVWVMVGGAIAGGGAAGSMAQLFIGG